MIFLCFVLWLLVLFTGINEVRVLELGKLYIYYGYPSCVCVAVGLKIPKKCTRPKREGVNFDLPRAL